MVETKSTNDINRLRIDEQIKLKSAKCRFAIMEDVSFKAPIDKFETFTKEW